MSFDKDALVLDELFTRPQFSIPQTEKEALLLASLNDLTAHHRSGSEDYGRMIDAVGADEARTLFDLPYLPVSLFKTHELMSIPADQVFKTMTSSGTTGQTPSQVFLDIQTATLQSKALTSIVKELIGPHRLPMLIIDTPNVVKDRKNFSARGAGVLGMLPFGRNHFYALDDDMNLNVDGVKDFLKKYSNQPFFMFGFTFMVWKYFFAELSGEKSEFNLSHGILLHSGGWKKLQEEAVSNQAFRDSFAGLTGLHQIHNFYGMVEQVGSIFVEGKDGFFYPPNFADVIVRDPKTWLPANDGEVGVIEVLSVLPRSYPGHVLLTEDLGVIHGTASGPGQWQGKMFEVLGRLPKAELRGCSDTHSSGGGPA